MRYTYEAIIEKDADGWIGRFPQFDSITQGETRDEVINRLSELLMLEIGSCISEKEPIPTSEHVVECLSVSVSLNNEDVDAMHYMTQEQAQEYLGISKARISQLAKSGQLKSHYFDGRNMVSIESVEVYASSSRKAGRPRKR